MIAVKGRLYAPKENLYGIMTVLFCEDTLSVTNAMIVVGNNNDIYRLTTNKKYSEFEKKIQDYLISGRHTKTLTSQLEEDLKNIMYNDYLKDKFIQSMASRNGSNIYSVFEELLSNRIHDDGLNLEFSLEEIDSSNVSLPQEETEETDSEKDLKSSIPVKLLISPINGKGIHTITSGSLIMVQPDVSDSSAASFIEKYGLKKEGGGIIPIPGEVISNQPVEKGREIIVKLDSETNGKIIEEEKVLVSIYDASKDAMPLFISGGLQIPEKKTPNKKDSSGGKTISSSNRGEKKGNTFLVVFGILAVVLILFAIFIFSSL